LDELKAYLQQAAGRKPTHAETSAALENLEVIGRCVRNAANERVDRAAALSNIAELLKYIRTMSTGSGTNLFAAKLSTLDVIKGELEKILGPGGKDCKVSAVDINDALPGPA
jgi:hypothetical protein